MLWYLADSSLNDYLKSQVVLQGKYYSDQQTQVAQAKFVNNTGVLTFDQLALAEILMIDNVTIQLAPVTASTQVTNASADISAKSQLILIEQVTINKLHINIKENSNGETNLAELEQKISLKLAADYPALYPELAAKLYAKKHPELNVNLDSKKLSQLNHTDEKTKTKRETNTAVLASNAAKKKKQLLGKASTRITILVLTINDLVIDEQVEGSPDNNIRHFTQLALPAVGAEHGLASNQLGGEILRLLLHTVNQLP